MVLSSSSDLLRVLDRAGCLSWPFREGSVYRGAPSWQGEMFMLELFQLPIWEELAYRLAANIWLLKHLALSFFASTVKRRAEGKYNPSPSSWAATQPRGTEISLQSHGGWS